MKHVTTLGAYDPIKPESRKQFVLAELRHAHRRVLALAAELEVIGTALREDIITSDIALDWAEENAPPAASDLFPSVFALVSGSPMMIARSFRGTTVRLTSRLMQKDRAETMPGYRLVTFDEMEVDPPAKQWLIKGILARGETSAWIAPPGAMKSALLAEAAICVGAGLDWHGYRNKGAAGVVYFAIERADLVKRRLRAHRQRLGLAGTPICVSSDTIDLTHPEAFKKVIDTIRTAKDDPGRRYRAGHHRHVRQADCCGRR